MNDNKSTADALQSATSTSRLLSTFLVSILNISIILIALSPATANAQTTCVPNAVGVFGQSRPPNWFDGSQDPAGPDRLNTQLKDPRWNGSVQQSYGDGTASQVEFRALHSNRLGFEALYLSWNVKVDPALTVDDDNRLYVGFGGTDDTLISITLHNAAPGEAQPQSQYTPSVSIQAANGPGNAYSGTGTPAWLTDRARIWVQNNPANSWAIQMVVPLSAAGLSSGINLPATFKMWYELRVSAGMSPYIIYTWPRNVTAIGLDMNLNDQFPVRSSWGDFRLTNGDADNPDPNCPTTGVSMKIGDVGTTNNPDSQINLTSPNTFVAKPLNNTGSAIPDKKILASFYIANWGTQIGVDDPNDPAGPWIPLRNGLNVESSGSTANGAQANISFPLTLNAAEKQPYLDGTKNRDQCLFVKLSSPLPLTFLNDSVRRNMDIVNASKFEREADISVVGLPDVASGPKRDVYLYVDTANLPAKVATPGGRGPFNRAAATRGPISGELDDTTPTYRVHAYYDTGLRVTKNGQTHIILKPGGSFGYYVIHNGDLEGWRHSLEGAQQIGPNLYLIAVPNHSAAKIKTTIEAVEPGVIPSGFKRWGVSLHAGLSIPHGDLNTFYNPGPNFGFDLEYRLTPTFSLEGIYGFHRFNGDTFGPFTLSDVTLHQFSANGKVYGGSSPMRPFFNFGGGAYVFTPGGNTHGGLNVGGGFQFDVNPNFAVDAMYNFHNVFTSGSSTQFSTVQGGVRFRF